MAMIIPMTQGRSGISEPAAQPSQTDLLMALAQMHKDGRFSQGMEDTQTKVDIQNIRTKGGFPGPGGYVPQATGKGKVDVGYEY